MVFSGYYNEFNQCLIISSAARVAKEICENGDIYFFDDENKIIGANIFIAGLKPGLTNLAEVNDSRLAPFLNEEHPFLYGHIKEVKPHPDSDHLNICQIDDQKQKQIVCGASNVAADKIAIVAQIGAVMPSGMVIAPSKLLKVDSEGMLCSEFELGKSQDKNGIFLSDELNLMGTPVY